MPRIILAFTSAQAAATNVAGVPAIARAAREAVLAAQSMPTYCEVVLVLPEGRLDDPWCCTELTRLAPSLDGRLCQTAALTHTAGDHWFAGELLVEAEQIVAAICADGVPSRSEKLAHGLAGVARFHREQSLSGIAARLRLAGAQIVRKTVKQSDGIVSRYLNRPISTRITRMLLGWRGVRPIHATALSALTALLMFTCLVSGTYPGLIAGAILFQVASVLDGIDGEIARATFRTSTIGATIDSLTDAATNLAFVTGLGFSLAQQGADNAAMVGVAGTASLGLGFALLGKSAAISGRPVNFDALKHLLRRRQSRLSDWIIWLTMRDFLALLGAVMVLLGLGDIFLQTLVAGSCLWLLSVAAFVSNEALHSRHRTPDQRIDQ